MKPLFYIFILSFSLVSFVGCDDEPLDEPLTEEEIWTREHLSEATTILNESMILFGVYDPASVGELLAADGALWGEHTTAKYNQSWSKIIDVYTVNWWTFTPSYVMVDGAYCLQFTADGKGVYGMSDGGSEFLPESLTWSFDPESRLLNITIHSVPAEKLSYVLSAIGEDVFVADSTDGKNVRRLYKPRGGIIVEI